MVILAAVADDDATEQVLTVAIRLGTAMDTSVQAVHLTTDEHSDQETREFRDTIQARLEESDVTSTARIEYSAYNSLRSRRDKHNHLADLVQDVDVDHAVIGYRSRDVIDRLVNGETARTLLETAEIPITVVPAAMEES